MTAELGPPGRALAAVVQGDHDRARRIIADLTDPDLAVLRDAARRLAAFCGVEFVIRGADPGARDLVDGSQP